MFEAPDESREKYRAAGYRSEAKPRVSPAEIKRRSVRVEQHDHENKEDHDGARIYENLKGRHQMGIENRVNAGEREKHHDEAEGARNRIAVKDHNQGKGD